MTYAMQQPGSVNDGTLGALMRQPGSVNEGSLGILMPQPGAHSDGSLGILMPQPRATRDGVLGVVPSAAYQASMAQMGARSGAARERSLATAAQARAAADRGRAYSADMARRAHAWALRHGGPLPAVHGLGATTVARRMSSAARRGSCLQGCQKQPQPAFGRCISKCTHSYPLHGLGALTMPSWGWLVGGAALLGAVVVMARRGR